jgi:hypothetical protein
MDSDLEVAQAPTANTPVKFTLKDTDTSFLNLVIPDDIKTNGLKGTRGDTLNFTYSGAQTGTTLGTQIGKYVSCYITEEGDDEVLYYGKLSDQASGTATFTVPTGLASGNYTIHTFNEQINEDLYSDFASEPIAIPLKVLSKVVFKDYDGSILSEQNIAKGGSATPPNPTRSGYKFTGWDSTAWQNVTADVTVTAQYSAVYPVTKHFDEFTFQGSGESTAIVDADASKFTDLVRYSDGKVLTRDVDYKVASGSTVITLSEAHLKNYVPGTHYFTAMYSDGSSESIHLVVKAAANANDPNGGNGGNGGSNAAGQQAGPNATSTGTGDATNLILLVLTAALAVIGVIVAGVVAWRRRRLHRQAQS